MKADVQFASPQRVLRNAMSSITRLAILALIAAPLALSRAVDSSAADPPPSSDEMWAISPQGKAPSADEIRARANKLVANQHRDDLALGQYERVEHHADRTAGVNPRTLEDRVYRVVPTGAGTSKIVLREGGKPVDPAAYSRQMQALRDLLQTMSNPNDSKAKSAYAKRAKRDHDRADFVDAAKNAFTVKWLGTSPCPQRTCDVFELDPDPAFHPHGMFQDALSHVMARVWVDPETNQMVRGEARVMSDISFGAGILGKLYRGGNVSMEQAEVAPGIWLPTHYQYDFTGRKFLFSFEQHQSIDASHYRRVGAPSETLLIVQDELANKKSFIADP
jgi:hypothetical protein